MKLLQLLFLLALAMPATSATQHFYDHKHFSKVLGEERNYRILLPPRPWHTFRPNRQCPFRSSRTQ